MTVDEQLLPVAGGSIPIQRSPGRRAWEATRLFRPVLVLVTLLLLIFGATLSAFFSQANLSNLLIAVAALWIVSMGMTLVVLTGGVDLSVGASAALVGIFLAKTLATGVPAWLAVVASVVFGGAVGALVNGLLIGWLRLSFFVVTIASMTALTGVVNLWSNAQSFYVAAPLLTRIGAGSVLGVPIPIAVMAVVFGVFLYMQSRTFFGRDIYAVGGSFSASRLSGINTTRTIVLTYGICGACAAAGGVLATARVGAATPQVDQSLPLLAVAAVLLGGTSLLGGVGGVGGTALGVLFIGILQNGLSIGGVASFWQQVITGVILVVAVLGDRVTTSGGGRWRWLRRQASAANPAPGSRAPASPR